LNLTLTSELHAARDESHHNYLTHKVGQYETTISELQKQMREYDDRLARLDSLQDAMRGLEHTVKELGEVRYRNESTIFQNEQLIAELEKKNGSFACLLVNFINYFY
jgi:predicted  nucleic acid-binding Zn-ribbon protein